MRRLSRASQDRVADVGAYVEESIHEIRTVQAFAHEDAGPRALRASASRPRSRRRAPHPPARAADARGDPAGVRRGRHHPVDRRARRAGRAAVGRRAVGLRVLCRDGRGVGRRDDRGDGRSAARRRRHRAADRAAGHAGRDRGAGGSRAAAGAAAATRRVRARHLPLSVAPRTTGARPI